MTDESRPLRFNRHGVWAIYQHEMARALRTMGGTFITPAITTSLYFIVFGSAMGSRMTQVTGVPYGAFIVPGLMMLSIMTESLSNASFGIYMPKFTGTIYEILSAPISYVEIVLAYVGASLPILLIFSIGQTPAWDAINSEAVATELVAILVGSIGLVLAVPVTTALAAILATHAPPKALEDAHTH